MEFDERKSGANSTLKLLRAQVDEQADVCDVTVKMGNWEKKYHRCVIMGSPFFECVLRNDFIEKKTGTITLHQGSPVNIDMAIMFLYGRPPRLSQNNIAEIVDMAEFFLIPNLKAACYNWLTRQSVTEETCLSWILLSSKYGFALEPCDEYIESHLPEVLNQPSAVNLTYESVDYILSSKKLVYFSMEDKLGFVIRWYIAQPLERKELTVKLIEKIKFDEISESCLNDVKCNPLVNCLLDNVHAGNEVNNKLVEVLISNYYARKLFCYDLAQDIWFQMLPDAPNREVFSKSIADTDPDASEVYFGPIVNHQNNNISVQSYNFVTKQLREFQVVSNTGEPLTCPPHKFNFTKTMSVSYESKFVKMKKEDKLHPRSVKAKLVTTIYIGHIVGEEIQMHPHFSIPDCHVRISAVNGNSVIALIQSLGHYLILYDTINCTIDKIPLEFKHDDRIFPYESGFVIHNNKRCVTIKRMLDPALFRRYSFIEIVFDNNEDTFNKYFFCKGTWYRFRQESCGSYFQFQCFEHSTLQQASSPSDAVWKELSPPNEDTWNSMHILQLPKRLLRCSIGCPHCKPVVQQRAQPIYYEDEDAIYSEDDSDRYYDEDERFDDYTYGHY